MKSSSGSIDRLIWAPSFHLSDTIFSCTVKEWESKAPFKSFLADQTILEPLHTEVWPQCDIKSSQNMDSLGQVFLGVY